ncbi:MAG: hypothetical protein ACFFCM_13465 [Promethearchaeota archaeon]
MYQIRNNSASYKIDCFALIIILILNIDEVDFTSMQPEFRIRNFNLLKMRGNFYVFKVSKLRQEINVDFKDFIRSLEECLNNFDGSDPESNVMDFRIIKNVEFPKSIKNDEIYKHFSERLIIIEFKRRKFSYRREFYEENSKIKEKNTKYISNYVYGYIFIVFPNLLIFKGSKDTYNAVWNDFYHITRGIIRIDMDYTFTDEFFLKLCERIEFKNKFLDNDFKINFVRDLSIEGINHFLRERIDASHLYMVLKSNQILMSILEKKKIKACIFELCLRNFYFTIEFNYQGSIILMQQRGHFVNLTQNERAFHGCYIIYRLVKYYDEWELLDPRSKYITMKFIKWMLDYLKSQEVDYLKRSLDFTLHYYKLRGNPNSNV